MEHDKKYSIHTVTAQRYIGAANGRAKQSWFTEEKITVALCKRDAGMKVSEMCRKHGISEPVA